MEVFVAVIGGKLQGAKLRKDEREPEVGVLFEPCSRIVFLRYVVRQRNEGAYCEMRDIDHLSMLFGVALRGIWRVLLIVAEIKASETETATKLEKSKTETATKKKQECRIAVIVREHFSKARERTLSVLIESEFASIIGLSLLFRNIF